MAKMKEDRLRKQLMFGTVQGRPAKSWLDCARDDLDSTGVILFVGECQDREGWNGIIEGLLQRT